MKYSRIKCIIPQPEPSEQILLPQGICLVWEPLNGIPVFYHYSYNIMITVEFILAYLLHNNENIHVIDDVMFNTALIDEDEQ